MITYRHKMLESPCIGHEGLGKRKPTDNQVTGTRYCVAEECLAYRQATTYLGDVHNAATEEESVRWKQLGKDYDAAKLDTAHPERLKEADATFSAFVDELWKKYTLGGCSLARHPDSAYIRYEAGQAYAD